MTPDAAKPTESDLTALRSGLDGDVLSPGDPGWDEARQPWNLVADQRPALVALAESPSDVAEVIRFSASHGLRVAPQGTGHGASSLAGLADAVLLRTSRMADVAIDPSTGSARVGAGCKWNDVVGPAAEHGLAALHGSSGTVGATGYILSGGLSWHARSRGFACNNVSSLEVVTADGQVRTATADAEPELFWALRGGGGAVGVVTGMEVDLVELREAYAGALMWPIEDAASVAQAWREWTEGVPDELTSTLKLLRFPPLPEVPDPLRGRALVAITFAYVGPAAEGGELIGALRSVGEPYMDMTGTIPAPGLAEIAGDPPGPIAGRGAGVLLDHLDADGVDAYVELAGPDVDVPLIQLELRHLGGALDRSSDSHGALDVAGGSHLLYGVGAVMGPESDHAIRSTMDRVIERMAPWTADRTLLGFAEQQADLRGSFPPEAADRLQRARATFDPDGLILANHA